MTFPELVETAVNTLMEKLLTKASPAGRAALEKIADGAVEFALVEAEAYGAAKLAAKYPQVAAILQGIAGVAVATAAAPGVAAAPAAPAQMG